jgi:hypothetical protein
MRQASKGATDEQSASRANPRASDFVLNEWSQNTTRMEEPPTWAMSSTDRDDALTVDDF